MNQAIFEQIQAIFQEVFEDENLVLNVNLTADEVPMWDSLTHLALISEVEKSFDITISFIDLMAFKNVGDLMNCVEKLISINSK